jgi:hypothetical protein
MALTSSTWGIIYDVSDKSTALTDIESYVRKSSPVSVKYLAKLLFWASLNISYGLLVFATLSIALVILVFVE